MLGTVVETSGRPVRNADGVWAPGGLAGIPGTPHPVGTLAG